MDDTPLYRGHVWWNPCSLWNHGKDMIIYECLQTYLMILLADLAYEILYGATIQAPNIMNVVAGDFNHDGQLDLMVVGQNSTINSTYSSRYINIYIGNYQTFGIHSPILILCR